MTQRELVEFLKSPSSYPHAVNKVDHLETHISHIFLTGDIAFKLKKEVKLSFLDFSSLSLRKEFCDRELKLNQRFAPDLYLEVIPVFQKEGTFSFLEGDLVDYLVKMNQFPTESLFTELIRQNKLTFELIEDTVDTIVSFHTKAEKAPKYWDASQLTNFIDECYEVIEEKEDLVSSSLQTSKQLTYELLSKYEQLLKTRQTTHVKLLHGDLHLKNICLYQGKPTLFDGIEFDDGYAASDGWGDIAFLIMDLLFESQEALATRTVNHYLELSDDYEGLQLLPLYIAYRALVRAKVAALESKRDSCQKHIALANQELTLNNPIIVAIGGLSGSGKSTVAKKVSELLRCVIIRSDAVRKHIADIALSQRGDSSLYTDEMTQRTYTGILARAQFALSAGYSVILDATFLNRDDRRNVKQFAEVNNTSFFGFWLELAPETLKNRIGQRKHDISDATQEVLLHQLSKQRQIDDWKTIDASESSLKIAKEILTHCAQKHFPQGQEQEHD
ncbi:MAG: AAA family ATPase [Bdellovibrionales bacterium]|nr:AAA family ATPase [Bdellovibrionales bacterium]